MPIRYVLQAPNIDKLQEFIPLFMDPGERESHFQMSDVDLKVHQAGDPRQHRPRKAGHALG